MWRRVACACTLFVFGAHSVSRAEDLRSSGPSPEAVAGAFLASQEFGLVRVSPDRRRIAVEIYRARSDGSPSLGELAAEGRTDLWIFNLDDGVGRKITSGGLGAGGAWAPVWSPNGDRVAFVTNRGTPGVARLAVWDLRSQSVIHESDRGISLDTNFGSAGPYAPNGRIPVGWTDNDHLLAVLMPKGEVEPLLSPGDPKSLFEPAWERSARGEVSATTWDARELQVCGTANELVSIDLKRGKSHHLVAGSIRAVSVAPNGSAAIVVRATSPVQRTADGTMRAIQNWNAYTMDPNVRSEAVYVSLTSGIAGQQKISGPFVPSLSVKTFPRWSDYSEDAFVLVLNESAQASLVRVSPSGKQEVLASGSSPARMAALAELVKLQKPGDRVRHLQLPASWEGAGISKEVVTIDLGGARFAILDDREVVVVDSRGIVEDRKVVGDVDLVVPPFRSEKQDHLIVRSRSSNRFSHITVSEIGIKSTDVPLPDGVFDIHGVLSDGSYVVRFQRGQSIGIGLLRNGSAIQPLATINESLSALGLPGPELVNLASSAEQPLFAQVFYPPGFRPGGDFPTIVNGYPGKIFAPRSEQTAEPLRFDDLEAYYLAAAGYVVVRPSILIAGDRSHDIIATLANDIDRSADALVRLGISDPKRIGFYGHSYGGFAGLAVAIQSQKFEAIVVSAAFADLFYYSTYVPSYYRREGCAPSRTRVRTYELETSPSLLAMRSAAFADLSRYLNNSAVYRATEISTPLLLMHGEFDMAPIESVEQLFMNLEARRVPTKLIRYWGEGHNLENPANIRDSLEQMTRWFDEHLQVERFHTRDTTCRDCGSAEDEAAHVSAN